MAKLNMYSVFDNKAQAFLPPFFLPNDAVAVRAFSNCANDTSHQFFRNANDFVLFRVGVFDDSLGSVESLLSPDNLGMAARFIDPSLTFNPLPIGGSNE